MGSTFHITREPSRVALVYITFECPLRVWPCWTRSTIQSSTVHRQPWTLGGNSFTTSNCYSWLGFVISVFPVKYYWRGKTFWGHAFFSSSNTSTWLTKYFNSKVEWFTKICSSITYRAFTGKKTLPSCYMDSLVFLRTRWFKHICLILIKKSKTIKNYSSSSGKFAISIRWSTRTLYFSTVISFIHFSVAPIDRNSCITSWNRAMYSMYSFLFCFIWTTPGLINVSFDYDSR